MAALVVVDLSAVEFLSCCALRQLVTASRHTRAMGGRFVIVRGRATVQRLFDLVGVDLEFEIVDAPPDCSRLPRSWAPPARRPTMDRRFDRGPTAGSLRARSR